MKYIKQLLIVLSVYTTSLWAAPTLIEIEPLDFAEVVPLTGACHMDYSTGVITDALGSKLCKNNPTGQPGDYVLIVGSNQNFQIKITSRLPQNGDGITFTPAGRYSSDLDNVVIIPDQFVTVNSGNVGRIYIKFGGKLTVTNNLNGSQNYDFPNAMTIEYLQVP